MSKFNKSNGNINNMPNFSCDSATINNLTANNFVAPIQPTGVYSTNPISDSNLVVGDGGNRNIKQSTLNINTTTTNASSLNTNCLIVGDNGVYGVISTPIL